MSNGKEIAAFEYGATSITITPLPGGARNFQLNMEGTVSGAWDATAMSTMNIDTDDMKNGTFSATVVAYLADGTVVTGDGVGTTQAIGGNKWRIRSNAITSDGHSISTDGEMDLATRSYKGKVYE
jgi:hypothetical protein